MFPRMLHELSSCMKRMSVEVLLVGWAPRTGNRGADALVNGDARSFDPRHELRIDPAKSSRELLPEALE